MTISIDAAPDAGAAATRSAGTGATRLLARFVTGLRYEQVPDEVVAKAKNLLLDYFGCLVTTTEEEMAKILYTVARTEGVAAVPEVSATIAGLPGRYTTEWAAFVNGAITHLSELDDTHRLTATHPGLGLFATAIAMAERTRPTGREFLTAVIAGYEVALRVALSVMPNHYVKGWNPSGTATMFGCAAVAAKLLDLDEEKTAWALGLAGVQVAGNRAHLTERVMTKDFNNGHAARCGISSGLLAHAGFSASTDELENVMGFWTLYGAGTVARERATQALGTHWHTLEMGHKPHPSCRFIHSSLDAAIEVIGEQRLDVQRIRTIRSTMSATGRYIVDDPEPWSQGKGTMGPRFSAQFNIAVAVLYGRDGLDAVYDPDVAQSYLDRPEVRAMMTRIAIEGDPLIDTEPDDFWKTELTIVLDNGTEHLRTVQYPLGEPENDLGTLGLVERFTRMTTLARVWDEPTARDVAARLLAVDADADAAAIVAHLPRGEASADHA